VIGLDRKRAAGRPVQCAEFVPAMIGIEVGDLNGAVRQAISSMATFVEDDAADLQPNFPGHMLDRAAFDASLVQRAGDAGAELRFAAIVKRISRDGAIELTDGTRLHARIVVGADGPRSLAGAAIGSLNTEFVETRQITLPLKVPHSATDIFLSADIPGGYGWLFPKAEVANLGAGVSPRHKTRLKAIVERLHAELHQRVGRKVLATTGGAIPVGGMLEPWGLLGETLVLLAGDAAGLANPVTGAGIAAAVHSGRLAGEAAVRNAPEAYEEELRDVFGAALERALHRRRALLADTPTKSALRRSWIAYPEYWQ